VTIPVLLVWAWYAVAWLIVLITYCLPTIVMFSFRRGW